MSPETHRLFFALWPGESVRTALHLAAQGLREQLHPAGRWIGAHRYHLTLHFLGDYPALPDSLVQRAGEAVASIHAPCFDLRIDRAGSFRNRDIPWWLGPEHSPEGLKQLWRMLREAFKLHTIPYDTRLRLSPHVTVLREGAQILPSRPVPAVEWPVREFVLVHSLLGPTSAYRLLGRWPLSSEAPAETAVVQRDLWENPPA